VSSLESINQQVDYAEFKYKDTLLQQLVCLLVHLSVDLGGGAAAGTPEEDAALLAIVRGKKHVLQEVFSSVESKVALAAKQHWTSHWAQEDEEEECVGFGGGGGGGLLLAPAGSAVPSSLATAAAAKAAAAASSADGVISPGDSPSSTGSLSPGGKSKTKKSTQRETAPPSSSLSAGT
jgi:hypothetical protein